MTSLQRKNEKGFTIIELLIVIVVIGILAALVITTFAGVQRRARNTERETDIKALHSQLEAYYAQQGYYPTLAQVVDGTTLAGLDQGALTSPPNNNTQIDSAAPTEAKYQYLPTPSGCTAGGGCTSYTLSWVPEGSAAQTKDALN